MNNRDFLTKEDKLFLDNFNPTIYWNDIDCYYWAFDTRLPSGRFITDIKFSGPSMKMRYNILLLPEDYKILEEEENIRKEKHKAAQKKMDWEQKTSWLIQDIIRKIKEEKEIIKYL